MNSEAVRHLPQEKSQLRQWALQARIGFRRAEPQADDALCAILTHEILRLKPARGLWLAYRAVRSEADPALAIRRLGGSWAYPKVTQGELKFFLVKDNSCWVTGPFGIPEPDPNSSQQIEIQMAEGVLVPGLMFDRQGNRIGSGQAFYDRALANFKGLKIGVAYSVQLSDHILPNESHDVAMDYIATDAEFFVAKGQKKWKV